MHECFLRSRLLKESPRIRDKRWIAEESSSMTGSGGRLS